jgi:hypothetical protein
MDCPPLPEASDRGFDVLVHAKEVRRIIFVLELNEAIVVRAIGRFGALVAFVTEIVYVHRVGCERAHRVPETAGPLK